MIISNSQNAQYTPLNTSLKKPVGEAGSAPDSKENKQTDKVQKQQDQAVLTQLRSRDREVRAHEAAHVSAGGSLVRGGPSFTFQKGPDGRTYAVGGEVQLDVSPVADDPDATLIRAGIIRNAALAPANPSAQDRRVASNANQLASRARVDIAVLRREEAELSKNQNTLESASSEESNEAASVSNEDESSLDNAATAASSVSDIISTGLKSNDAPVAAISAFMATVQSEAVPARFSQFA